MAPILTSARLTVEIQDSSERKYRNLTKNLKHQTLSVYGGKSYE